MPVQCLNVNTEKINKLNERTLIVQYFILKVAIKCFCTTSIKSSNNIYPKEYCWQIYKYLINCRNKENICICVKYLSDQFRNFLLLQIWRMLYIAILFFDSSLYLTVELRTFLGSDRMERCLLASIRRINTDFDLYL